MIFNTFNLYYHLICFAFPQFEYRNFTTQFLNMTNTIIDQCIIYLVFFTQVKKSSSRTSPLGLPNKRHSISVLSSTTPSKKSSRSSSRRPSSYHVPDEPDNDDREDSPLSASGPPCFSLTSTPLERGGSPRRNSLLPSQQTCEVDEENESSLLNELMEATRSSVGDFQF